MRKNWQIDRRTFLRGLGLSMGLPLLDIMAPSKALAANGKMQRLIYVYIANGVVSDNNCATPPPYLKALTGDIAAKCNYITGLSNTEGDGSQGHFGNYWTLTRGGAGGIGPQPQDINPGNIGRSFDQYIAPLNAGTTAATVSFNGWEEYSPYNYLPVLANNPSWIGPNQYVEAYKEPLTAFNKLFSGTNPVDVSTREADQIRRKRGILHYAMEDIRKIRTVASTDDKVKLEQYFGSIEGMERDLARLLEDAPSTVSACQSPAEIVSVGRDQNYPLVLKMYYDIMFFAIKCDMSRVFTFLHAPENNLMQHKPFIPSVSTYSGWHTHSHYDSADQVDEAPSSGDPAVRRLDYETITAWHHTRVADFVRRLNAEPASSGTGTLLDESLVVWGSHYGFSQHSTDSLYWTTAGSANGTLKTGITYNHGGQTISDLWLTIMRAFGVTNASFGNSTGEIEALKV